MDTYDSFLLAEFTSLFTTPVQLLLSATEKDDRFRLNPTQVESHFSVHTDLFHVQRDSLQSGSGEREPERERHKDLDRDLVCDLDRDLEQRRPRLRGGEREDERELERDEELLPECLDLYLKIII